jgi:hypothetical protein
MSAAGGRPHRDLPGWPRSGVCVTSPQDLSITLRVVITTLRICDRGKASPGTAVRVSQGNLGPLRCPFTCDVRTWQ